MNTRDTKPRGSAGRGLENVQPPPNPAGPGNARALKHGARSELRIRGRAAELSDYLETIVPAVSPADWPLITLLARDLAKVEAISEFIEEHGLTNPDGSERKALLRDLATAANSAARNCDRLGLSPTSRARLGFDLTRTAAVHAEQLRAAEGAAAEAEARIAGEGSK